ncbi:MAG: PAS domain S-box protein [Pyrinomonadaceae bacterium]
MFNTTGEHRVIPARLVRELRQDCGAMELRAANIRPAPMITGFGAAMARTFLHFLSEQPDKTRHLVCTAHLPEITTLNKEDRRTDGLKQHLEGLTDRTYRSGLLDIRENWFRGFIENLPVPFYVVAPVPPFSPLYVSPAFERFGFPIEAWTLEPDIWRMVIHPEDQERIFSQTDDSTRSGEAVDYEYRIIDAAGKLHWVRDRGCLIRDAKGEVRWREGVILDVTDRKDAEDLVRSSGERFRNLFDNANDAIYVHDLKGNYISINQATEKIFGYTRDEALGLNMSAIVAPDHLERVRSKLKAKLNGAAKQTSYEVDCIRKDGSRITVEVSSTVITENGVPVGVQGIARDVTERKLAEEALRESEVKYRDLFENANDLIYTHDLNGNFTSLNRTGELITGYTRDEALTMNISQVVAPASLPAAREMTARKMAGDPATTYEIDILAKDGRIVSLELSTQLIHEKGRPAGVQGIARNITERKRHDRAIKDSELRYRQLGEGISHQVWTGDGSGKVDYVNERMVAYLGRSREDLISGNEWPSVVHPDDLDECLKRWQHSVESGETYDVEFRLKRHDGVYRWHKARATCGLDENGKISKWFGTNTDIDDQKQSEEKLHYFARHDPLTDLLNRAEFMYHLQHAIDRAKANPAARFAVLFLDLDRFKVINDSLGHLVGDQLLCQIGRCLEKNIRPGDVVARLGGDEFTILLNRTGGLEEVIHVAERVQHNLASAFQIDNHEVFTSASIGIIVSDDISRQPEDFLRDADTAMYRAKEAGKARYEIFDRRMHAQNLNQLALETDLRHAVERAEFELHYQPIVELPSWTVKEFEALIRWRHPKHGIIGPDTFVNAAEESGLMIPIGRWILREACRQIAEWQTSSDVRLAVSVNLSAKQLLHPSLVMDVSSAINETGLSADQLKIEVTENIVMEHSDRSLSVLSELAALGISLSTDDFGTGYSSLSYLQRFPFSRLKIDRSFMNQMSEDPKSGAIVKTIQMLGDNLGLEVVAEGIETEQQLEALLLFGCKFGQGYLFARPLSAEDGAAILRSGVNALRPQISTEIAPPAPIFEVSEVQ